MTGGGDHGIEHGFESPKHRVSLGLLMNSYVHRKQDIHTSSMKHEVHQLRQETYIH